MEKVAVKLDNGGSFYKKVGQGCRVGAGGIGAVEQYGNWFVFW